MLVIFNIFLPLFYRETESRYQCNGQYIRGICHLSILDMQEIFQRNTMEDGKQSCFVANKFNIKVDGTAIMCTAHRIYLQEYMAKKEMLINSK